MTATKLALAPIPGMPKGLRGYEREVAEIMAWLVDWISQDEFDAKAAEAMRQQRSLTPAIHGESYILGIGDPFGEHLHLEVLQVLQRETDLIDAVTRDDGLVWYRLRPPAQDAEAPKAD